MKKKYIGNIMSYDIILERATERDAKENGYGGYEKPEVYISCPCCRAENISSEEYCWSCGQPFKP